MPASRFTAAPASMTATLESLKAAVSTSACCAVLVNWFEIAWYWASATWASGMLNCRDNSAKCCEIESRLVPTPGATD